MRTSCLAITVVAMAIGLSAPARGVSQDKIPQIPIQRPAVAKGATVTGCVAQGATPDTLVLTHATREVEGMTMETAKPVTLVLSGTDVDLSKHVGHKVSLTGWDVPAEGATSATVATEASSAATAAMAKETGTKVRGVFNVKSLKMLSSSCSEAGD